MSLPAIIILDSLILREEAFAHSDALWRYLNKFVITNKLKALFKAQLKRRRQPQRFIRTRGSHVGNVLFLADVDCDILVTGAFAHYLAFVNGISRAYEQPSALLRVEKSIGIGFSGLGSDEGAPGAFLDFAGIWFIILEYMTHYTIAPGIGQ